jgi:hypothetical protein
VQIFHGDDVVFCQLVLCQLALLSGKRDTPGRRV